MGCHFLLQGIFPTQGSNPDLLHYRQPLYRLSHQGSPNPKASLTRPPPSRLKPFRASLELSPHGAVSRPSPGSLHSPTLSHHRACMQVVSAGGCAPTWTPLHSSFSSTGSAVPDPQPRTPLQAQLRTHSSYPTTTVCPSHRTGNPRQQGLFLRLLTSLNTSMVNECWTKG